MLAGVGSGSSIAAFDRMSEKVEQLEAEADVSKQLARPPRRARAPAPLSSQSSRLSRCAGEGG
eukprot:2108467-Prymnesium_polylepis.1